MCVMNVYISLGAGSDECGQVIRDGRKYGAGTEAVDH